MKRYLRHCKRETIPPVKACVERAVEDYNQTRTHGSLKGATPLEVYSMQTTNLDFSGQIQKTGAHRTAANQKSGCGVC